MMTDHAFHTELATRIVSHDQFKTDLTSLRHAGISRELGVTGDTALPTDTLTRLLRAACALACSSETKHQQVANDIASLACEVAQNDALNFNAIARVVLSRLKNFPSRALATPAHEELPLTLQLEATRHRNEATISVSGREFTLNYFQLRLWSTAQTKTSLLLCAPTSAGKSFALKLHLISQVLRTGTWSLYLAPTRALVRQVGAEIGALIAELDVHDCVVRTAALHSEHRYPGIYVLTQERFNTLLEQPDLPRFGTIFVDEAQGLEDGHRGVLLWEIVEEVRRRQPNCHLIFAAPFAKDPTALEAIAGELPTTITSTLRPVPSLIHRITVRARTAHVASGGLQRIFELPRKPKSDSDALALIAAQFGRDRQSLVYAPRPSQCAAIAKRIMAARDRQARPTVDSETSEDKESIAHDQLRELASFIREEIHPEFSLAMLVEKGLAYHYGRLPGVLRTAIEDALSRKILQHVVCTSTLLQGVNLPARNIFIGSSKKGTRRHLSSADFWNLAGRAGRLGADLMGNVFLVNTQNWDTDPSTTTPDETIRPSFSVVVRDRRERLLAFAEDVNAPSGDRATRKYEAAFTSLFLAERQNRLPQLWKKLTGTDEAPSNSPIGQLVKELSTSFSVPTEVVHGNRSISPRRQEEAWKLIVNRIQTDSDPLTILPTHPKSASAYERTLEAFKFINVVFLKLPKHSREHKFHATMALKWMRGESLSLMIAERIRRHGSRPETAARQIFDLIETDLRYRFATYLKCYIDMIARAITEAGHGKAADAIPPLPLYLEVGACTMTAISFITVGLSRTTANTLAAYAPPELDESSALSWLSSARFEALRIPQVCVREVYRLLGASGD